MKWLLCQHCIEAIRSRGERLVVLGYAMSMEEAEEEGIVCEWCEEADDLYECD